MLMQFPQIADAVHRLISQMQCVVPVLPWHRHGPAHADDLDSRKHQHAAAETPQWSSSISACVPCNSRLQRP